MDPFYALDGIANEALGFVGLGTARATTMLTLANALDLSVLRVPAHELPDGAVASLCGRIILVRTAVDAVSERWAIAHEIGHHLCSHMCRDDQAEQEANYIAACLIVL